MLNGIDDVDWASMRHAYGPADDVPDMLRGLLDDDEDVRANAREGMWGAVHHQGDVYDSTLATIPFLIAMGSHPGPAQDVALGLLGSYASIDFNSLLEDGDAVPWLPEGDTYKQARELVAGARGVYLEQLSADEPRVRQAAVCASLAGPPTGEVVEHLQDLFARETDPETRTLVQAALGWLNRRGVSELDSWAQQQEASVDPAIRLTSLIEAARRGSALNTATMVGAIRRVYDQHGPPAQASGGGGFLVRRATSPPRRAEAERRVIARLTKVLPDASPLLKVLLVSPDWEIALDSVDPTGEHIRQVRGDHSDLITLLAAKLVDAPVAAGRALMVAGPLARPARDALASAPADENVLAALVNLQDSHALPHLRAALRQPRTDGNIGFRVARLGPVALPLRAEIVRALKNGDEAVNGLLHAAASLGLAEAVPAIVRFLPNEYAIRALRLLGTSAREAAPRLRPLLDAEPKIAIAAAHALWTVDSNLDGLSVILRELESPTNGFTYRAAADAAGDVGSQEAVPALLHGLQSDDPYGWPQLHSAQALLKIDHAIAADGGAVTTALRGCWSRNESIRLDVTKLLLVMGAAGTGLIDLVQEEACNPLRLAFRQGGWSSEDVARDEELLANLKLLINQDYNPT